MPTAINDPETPRVRVTNFELLRLLDGNELKFAVSDGSTVIIQLYDTDELLEDQHRLTAGEPELQMTRAQAAQLCAPVDISALVTRLGESQS